VPESKMSDSIRKFLQDLADNPLEERIVEYIVREVRNGRKLSDALSDPYVRNRLSEERVQHVLEHPEVVAAIEEQISTSFQKRDFGFND
jgi:hypothetical protein